MSNQGHGHVTPRDDGVKLRCGGIKMCPVCQAEFAARAAAFPFPPAPDHVPEDKDGEPRDLTSWVKDIRADDPSAVVLVVRGYADGRLTLAASTDVPNSVKLARYAIGVLERRTHDNEQGLPS